MSYETDYGVDLTFAARQPTRVVFGDGAVAQLGDECARLGITRALVVTDRVLRERTDVVQRVEHALGERRGALYDGVIADSGVHIVDDGAALAREHGCDGVVSLGGGSALDSGKGIALVLQEGGSIRERIGRPLPRRQTPHLALPTTAGTGGEVTMSLVVKDHAAHQKLQILDEQVIPDAAILDPSLTVDMPRSLTAATGLDALTLAIEAFTSARCNPIADGLAIHAMRLGARWLGRACEQPDDKVARGQLLIAANIAGQAFNSTGLGLVHAMAHAIGARHGTHSGTANAVCLPHVIRFNADAMGARYRCVAEALGLDARDLGDDLAGEAAAQAVAQLLGRVQLPTRLRDVGVPEAGLPALADAAFADAARLHNGKPVVDRDELLAIFRRAH